MSSVDEIEQAAAQYLAQEDRGLQPHEQLALDAWLAQSTAHRVAYLRLKSIWRSADRLAALKSTGPVARPAPRFGSLSSRLLAAAMLLLCLGGALIAYFQYRGVAAASVLYVTAVGQQKSVKLADGSDMVMNTDSRVQARVSGTQRQITLERGQAFFQIAHDATHPFVVNVGNRRIMDVGTAFSVFRNGDQVEILVKEGRVRLDLLDEQNAGAPVFANGGSEVIARAHETLVAARTPQEIQNALNWRYGMLTFNREALADVAAEFNRYNVKHIVVEGPARDIRLGGSFQARNIDAFVLLIKEGFGLKASDDDRVVIVSK